MALVLAFTKSQNGASDEVLVSFPQAWEETPPEVPGKGERVSSQISQFAKWLRDKILTGELLDDKYLDWLYDYEVLHPAPGGATTFLRLSEEKTKREITAIQQQKNLPEAAAVVHQEGQRLDRIVEALSEGIRELRQGFSQAIKEVGAAYQNSMGELRQGVSELREGYAQLNGDHRAFLGLIFPHQENMHKLANEGMTTYREALLMESKATQAIAQSQGGADFVSKQADMMMMSLVSDVARKKMGLDPATKGSSPEAQKKAAQPKEPPKGQAPTELDPQKADAFWGALMKRMQPPEPPPTTAVPPPEPEE